MIRAGITGGIGSGKSVVSELFRLHGVPVYDADREAKYLNDTSPSIRQQLTDHFGGDLYAGGSLNRPMLASLMFHDEKILATVNTIIHPVLANHFAEWCALHTDHRLVMIDAAVLFEAGFHRYLDQVVTVFAPKEIRMERVMHRDHSSREAVERRMKHQLPENEKMQRSDFVIYNDDRHSLIRQTADILEKLRKMGEQQ